ncbi:tetraspanin-33-like isoform X2 [Lineus longissimus]|uniref:tetraspanin-33-like isoform X2 n=1 Tax=Lineus longissimus TaxID=88925 RepID=UPI002B4F340E
MPQGRVDPRLKYNKDDTYVNLCVKYSVFVFNLLFWIVGAAMIGIGAWAYMEKNKFFVDNQPDINSIYDIIFDVSIIIIVVGAILFIWSFAGCIGALRENNCLLKFFYISLALLFLLEVVGGILAFVFSNQVKERVTKVLQEEAIVRYRDDLNLMNIMDWFQENFGCCGVGNDGYKDWEMNVYFNSSSDNPSGERGAVPFSCCRTPNNLEDDAVHINKMCGYEMLSKNPIEAAKTIYTGGCVSGVIKVAEDNMLLVGGVSIGVAVFQIIAISLARVLDTQIASQKDRWV